MTKVQTARVIINIKTNKISPVLLADEKWNVSLKKGRDSKLILEF